MPLDHPFTTLLHPDQALTVEQAATWVRDLIDYYSQNVSALCLDTLPEDALRSYMKTLSSLLECAGVLEQHLCGMCFFLPDEVSRAVVAIIVVAYYQSALLDPCIKDPAPACIVVDGETLETMDVYLGRVAEYITPLYESLTSERNATLRGVAKKVVTEMRNRTMPAHARVGSNDAPSCPRNPPREMGKNKDVDVPFARLVAFLCRLSPDHFADVFSASGTGMPLVRLSSPPKDGDTSSSPGPSSPTAASSSSSHALLFDDVHDEPERRHSLASSDTTCVNEPALGSPFHLETKFCSSPEEIEGQILFKPARDVCSVGPSRTSAKRRRETLDSSHPRKRRCQISLRTFAPDGSISSEDVEIRARSYVGRAVPIRRTPRGRAGSPVPLLLPPRNISISPNASQGSACTPASLRARSLSPLGLEGVDVPSEYVAPQYLTVPGAARISLLLEASRARRWEEESVVDEYGMDGEVDARSEDGEDSDRESYTTANDELYGDVGMEDDHEREGSAFSSHADLDREEEVDADEDKDTDMDMDKNKDKDDLEVSSATSPSSPPPVLSAKAKGKRRCFESLFNTFKHIFNGC